LRCLSITEPAIQRLYRDYVVAIVDVVRPTHIGSDLDISAFPQPPGSTLPLFAALGMVDTQLRPKPALAAWDSLYARRRQ
jgi:hypothetical protein